MKFKSHQKGMISIRDELTIYISAVCFVFWVAYKHSGWSAAFLSLSFFIGVPLLLIVFRFAQIKAQYFLSAQKYSVEIANFLGEFPDGELAQISPERWEIISKNTGKKLAKIFLKSTGEITKVNLKIN